MTPMRILTVDDEPLALRRLKLLLQTIADAEHVGEASGCAEAVSKLHSLRPDVALVDIKMRDGTGFEVAEAAARLSHPPVVIFVTAYDQYAVRAFDSAIADYLLKPVESDRLQRALVRARQRAQAKDAEQRVDELQLVLSNLRSVRNAERQPSYETEFWLRSSHGLVRVPVDAIDWVASADEYVSLHTATGSHLMRGSIKQFVDRVEPGLFVRVHRRWLVKRSAITELSSGRIGRAEVVLRNGKRLPAGRVHLKQLRQVVRSFPPAAG